MTLYDKPVRLLFWDMVDDLGLQKRQVITKQQGIDWFRKNYPSVKRGTITAHFIKLSTNAPSRVHYDARPEDDLFYQIDGSHFRKYVPGTDPPPIYWKVPGEETYVKANIKPPDMKPLSILTVECEQQHPDKSRSVESNKYRWSRLNRQQIGRYAEYYVMMEFTLYGFEVYSSEVDDRGIDFVVRGAGDQFYEVQVKSIRDSTYVLFPKSKFELRNNLLAALVIFTEGKMPDLFIIRATKWEEPNALLVSRDYKGLKSTPEWGMNLSIKNLPMLEQYRFDKVVENL